MKTEFIKKVLRSTLQAIGYILLGAIIFCIIGWVIVFAVEKPKAGGDSVLGMAGFVLIIALTVFGAFLGLISFITAAVSKRVFSKKKE